MQVRVDVKGEAVHEVAVDPGETTYGDLLDVVGLSRHEATVLVDGRPVPEDGPVDGDIEGVTVLRLVKGG